MDKKIIDMICAATGMDYAKSQDPDCLYCWFMWDGIDMPDWMPAWVNGTGADDVFDWIVEEAKTNDEIKQAMLAAGLDKVRIVRLEDGVWLAPWSGDPGRTLIKRAARLYATERGAAIALGMARKHRPFKNAVIMAV